jgi:hypothetical protein
MSKDDWSRRKNEWMNTLTVSLNKDKKMNKNGKSVRFYPSFTAVITDA